MRGKLWPLVAASLCVASDCVQHLRQLQPTQHEREVEQEQALRSQSQSGSRSQGRSQSWPDEQHELPPVSKSLLLQQEEQGQGLEDQEKEEEKDQEKEEEKDQEKKDEKKAKHPPKEAIAQDEAKKRRKASPRKATLEDGPVRIEDDRLQHVLNVGASVEDFESRAKPTFISIPGQEAQDRLTSQQRMGMRGAFDQDPDDFRDCMLIHQYATPLEVIDSYEMESHVWAKVWAGEAEDGQDNSSVVAHVLTRPGAVYDSATKNNQELHISTSMVARLEGLSNPVQVIPHGAIASWSSKERVPIAGFLCMEQELSDSAPVLHATPTPCVPTTFDAEGNALNPLLDPYEVFIGSTRIAFQNKEKAERFCLAYAQEIARDLGTLVWDAEDLRRSVEPVAAPAPAPAPAAAAEAAAAAAAAAAAPLLDAARAVAEAVARHAKEATSQASKMAKKAAEKATKAAAEAAVAGTEKAREAAEAAMRAARKAAAEAGIPLGEEVKKDQADEDKLSKGDVCYRFCEDGSEEPLDLRQFCPSDFPCESPLRPGTTSFDSCGDRAHTCGGGAEEEEEEEAPSSDLAAAPAPGPAPRRKTRPSEKSQEEWEAEEEEEKEERRKQLKKETKEERQARQKMDDKANGETKQKNARTNGDQKVETVESHNKAANKNTGSKANAEDEEDPPTSKTDDATNSAQVEQEQEEAAFQQELQSLNISGADLGDVEGQISLLQAAHLSLGDEPISPVPRRSEMSLHQHRQHRGSHHRPRHLRHKVKADSLEETRLALSAGEHLLTHHRHRGHRGHRDRRDPQSGPGSPGSEPERFSWARLRDDEEEDVLGKGLPSMSLVHNPDLLNFVTATRKRNTPEGWTKGTKRLLMVIMDWKEGDETMSPYSKQDDDPIPSYRDKILPEVQKIFQKMSFGQFQLDVTFVPEVVHYSRNRNQMSGKLPFPTLYNEAREALQSHPKFGSEEFAFRNFDLAFVLHPQVNPVGTKGMAWIGARGAICNGCETISDEYKIMVIVHELGHNLGLSHASSEALEYGNPFDWMGNYPNVVGLHYGLGYKSTLQWISAENIMDVTDANLQGVNDLVSLLPYDGAASPQSGEVVGVRISLRGNQEDLYLSFRSTLGAAKRGVFVVYQAKDSPHSKLMDAACHSPSQQDAKLQEGWTFMDGSQQVVIRVLEETDGYAKVHIYHTPDKDNAVSGIRARKAFTDGRSKCPRTCQDSDLIISQTCEELKAQGYCTGQLKLQGKRMSIGREVCPQTCGFCDEVLAGPAEVSSEAICDDKPVRISGMDCPTIAAKDMCGMKTTSGKQLGDDLCRMSCGSCPQPPPAASAPDAEADFPDPEAARVFSGGVPATQGSAQQLQKYEESCPAGCSAPECRDGEAVNGGQPLSGPSCSGRCSRLFGDVRYCGLGGEYEAEGSLDCTRCPALTPFEALKVGTSDSPICPSACMAPEVLAGRARSGGRALNGDKCTARATKLFGGTTRYCGVGGVYEAPGSVDCSACGPSWSPSKSLQEEDDKKEVLAEQEGTGNRPSDPAPSATTCEDDESWSDPDGHDCETYRNTIAAWGKERVCKEYKGGIASLYCRATCETCKDISEDDAAQPEDESGPSRESCADNICIGPWLQAYGRCFQCADFLTGCSDPKYKAVFHAECPLTCGICQAEALPTPGPSNDDDDDDDACEDSEPICEKLGQQYCSEGRFAQRCKRTCNLCPPPGAAEANECVDRFSAFTCRRYESYGWCTREDTKATVQLNCPLTCGLCGGWAPPLPEEPGPQKRELRHSHRDAAPARSSWIHMIMLLVLGLPAQFQ